MRAFKMFTDVQAKKNCGQCEFFFFFFLSDTFCPKISLKPSLELIELNMT